MAYDFKVRGSTKLDTKELEKGLSSLKTKLNKFGSDLKKQLGNEIKSLADSVASLGKRAATAATGGIAALTAGAVAFGKSAVTAFTEAEEASAQLAKMLQNTGNSKESIQDLEDYTKELSKGSVLAGSNLTAMEKQLATFDMSAEGIKQLLPALADMAVAEKGLNASMDDYVGIAKMMGKAVQGDVSGLSRMGFIIEEDVIKAIKNASTEEERLAMINDILGQTYSNLAAEMKNSFAG